MKKITFDMVLKVILTIILFAIPVALSMVIWFTPELETNSFLVGVSTLNIILSMAEVMFLVRAVVFPPKGRRWWREMYRD